LPVADIVVRQENFMSALEGAAPAADDTDDRLDLADVRRRLKAIFIGSVGNLVEWYDFYAYAAFALYFAPAFFPGEDPVVQQLNAAVLFAAGFIVRPLGGWLFGHLADHYGRRNALTLSVVLMCFGSLMIAVTPTYATIGIWAPILLAAARILQGLSLGGEYGTSATYLTEISDKRHRGFYSSFQYVTLIGGQLCAILVLLLLQKVFLTNEEIRAWGWRIPFVIGAACAIVALWLRRGLDETEAFRHARGRAGQASLRGLLAHRRAVATVVGLTAGGTVAFYTFTTYAQKFLVNTAGWTKDDATRASAASLLVFMLLQPLVGLLSDRVGRRPVLMTFGVLGTLGTVPLLTALGGATRFGEGLALLVLALTVVSGYTAINAVVKAELFPAEVRALGVGFPYAVTVSVFAGTVEYLALWAHSAGRERWFYWYVTACIAGSLIVYVTMPETRDRSAFRGEA
jgi:MHS family alpha-ketoglutarate permease-like MFS transporter